MPASKHCTCSVEIVVARNHDKYNQLTGCGAQPFSWRNTMTRKWKKIEIKIDIAAILTAIASILNAILR
jgi:hypothetical protein